MENLNIIKYMKRMRYFLSLITKILSDAWRANFFAGLIAKLRYVLHLYFSLNAICTVNINWCVVIVSLHNLFCLEAVITRCTFLCNYPHCRINLFHLPSVELMNNSVVNCTLIRTNYFISRLMKCIWKP